MLLGRAVDDAPLTGLCKLRRTIPDSCLETNTMNTYLARETDGTDNLDLLDRHPIPLYLNILNMLAIVCIIEDAMFFF
jgi:hypothetical protein